MKHVKLFELAVAERVSNLEAWRNHDLKQMEGGKVWNVEFLTASSAKKFNDGDLTKEEAEKKINKAFERKKAKAVAEIEALFSSVESSKDFEGGKIEVNWTRSRAWGMNPRAVFTSYADGVYTGSASGCGYDKLSASVAEALNQCLPLKKAFFDYVENCLKDLTEEETVGFCKDYGYRKFLPYGTGYSATTFFEGGVGVNCYKEIFDRIGFEFKQVENEKTYDVFTIARK